MQPSSRLRSFSSRKLPTILRTISQRPEFRRPGFRRLGFRRPEIVVFRAPPEIGGPTTRPGNSLAILAKSWKPLASKCRIGDKTACHTDSPRLRIVDVRATLVVVSGGIMKGFKIVPIAGDHKGRPYSGE